MKRKALRKLFCLLLTLCMLVSQLPQILAAPADSPYEHEFSDGETFNITAFVNPNGTRTIADGVLKLTGFSTGRFIDTDSPSSADGVLTTRFKSSVVVERFGFAVRTNNNTTERMMIIYDPENPGVTSAGWYCYGPSGTTAKLICAAAAPKANTWYTLRISYKGTDVELSVTEEGGQTLSGKITATGAYTGAGQLGIFHWGYTTKNIEIDYLRWTPYEENSETPADSVKITVPKTTITVGESIQATAQVLPQAANQVVTWSIKNNATTGSVTPVGEVKGVAAGTFTLVATTGNGKTDEVVITVEPAPEAPVYHRTFDERDEIKTFRYTSVQDNYQGAAIEDGYLKLPNFFGRILDNDSPALKDGVMTARFKIGENAGRYGFFVRTTSASERIMVAYDSGNWKWYGTSSASGNLDMIDTLKPDVWYTIQITYVGNKLKALLTNEETGDLSVIGKVTMGSAPAGPGRVGFVSWWAAKDMTIDEITVAPYKEPAPPTAPEYSALTITDAGMTVSLDNRFPTVNGYVLNGKTMSAQPTNEFLYTVTLNGDDYRIEKVTASAQGNTAVYDLEVPIPKNPDILELGYFETPLKLQVTFTADGALGSLTMDTKVVSEPKGFRIRSLGFPNLKLAGATYNSGAGARTTLEGVSIGGGYNSIADRRYNLSKGTYNVLRGGDNTPVGQEFSALGDGALSYAFLSNGDLAATILNNIDQTNQKNTVNVAKNGTDTYAAIGSGSWDYRGPRTTVADDEKYPPLESLWSQVVLRDDVNGDGAVDWQDAAIGYRACMEKPYGSEDIRDYVSYIMYNAASKAQSDTNVSADMMKKFYNLYDGFGQMQLQKGYQAEGHDDAHNDAGGHIGERIGGVKGFRELLAAGDKYNTKVGVHVNITEMMLDSFYIDNDLFKRSSTTGDLSVNWQWYDPAYYVDEDKDLLGGTLKARFDQLAADTTLPGQDKSSLDWIYVDIYGRSDWHSRQVSEMFTDYGWVTTTEFSGPFAQQTVWTHWGTDLYYPTSGQGSKYLRFIRNTDADIFPANDPTSGTLLKGMQQPSPNAWVNIYEVGEAVSLFYEHNLISKYLQYFPILTWNEANTRISFEGGVVSELINGQMVVSRNGKPVAYCDVVTSGGKLDVRADSLVFIPWNPLKEDKIYHWNPDGGATTWTLPDSWKDLAQVYLYQTTEHGKTLIGAVTVSDGKVTINAKANTPYVLYKTMEEAAGLPAAGDWSENSFVKDTGFDAQVFVDQDEKAGRWERSSEDGTVDHIGFAKDVRWNNLLVINSAENAVVSQKITGLTPGKDYAMTVWALVENDNNRMVSLGAENSDGTRVESYLTKTDITAIKNKFQTTKFRRMRIILEADETGTATVYLKVADGSGASSKVKFDDVRIWEHVTDTPQGDHYYFDDFENVDFSLGALEHDSTASDNVHLADQHPDFNNGAKQYLSYVISGRYSGKINDTATAVGGSILRTHPSVLRFQPETSYRVGITYYTPIDGAYKLVAKDSTGKVLAELPLPKNGEVNALGENGKQTDPSKRKPRGTAVTFVFKTGADENCYISLVKTAATTNRATTYLILDDFFVDDLTTPGRRTALEYTIAQAETLNPMDYTAASRAAFVQALAAAKLTLDNASASKAEWANAQNALTAASGALVPYEKYVDGVCVYSKRKLESLIKQFETMVAVGSDQANVLEDARLVLENASATVEDVEAAYAAIEKAFFSPVEKLVLNVPANVRIARASVQNVSISWNPTSYLADLMISSSNPSLVTATLTTNGLGAASIRLTALRTGTAIVTVKANDGTGTVAAMLVTVS